MLTISTNILNAGIVISAKKFIKYNLKRSGRFMNFKTTISLVTVAILLLCHIAGCRYLPEHEKADYCHLVKSLQIGPYDFTDQTPVEIIFAIFNDANSEIARYGYLHSIGITLQTSDDNLYEKTISISIKRDTIFGVLGSVASEIGCTVNCENGIVQFRKSNDSSMGKGLDNR